VAGLALALGVDTLLVWGLRLLLGLVVLGLVVTLMVIQTAAGVLTGGKPTDGRGGPWGVAASRVTMPMPEPRPTLPGGLSASIVDVARAWLGVPYVFGGCSRTGVDCSCLVQNVYAAVGVRLPRVAVDQFNATLPIADPQPGDLVFFANTYQPGVSHVGIYVGNGLQINAPQPGQFVSIESVFTGYWGAHFVGARRVA